jgi:hypothetical protein
MRWCGVIHRQLRPSRHYQSCLHHASRALHALMSRSDQVVLFTLERHFDRLGNRILR